MTTFIPVFYVTNRQGLFLAKNDKTGPAHLPVKWVRDRKDAWGHKHWKDADLLRYYLPPKSVTTIVDQLGDIWTIDRAIRAHAMDMAVQHVVDTIERYWLEGDGRFSDQRGLISDPVVKIAPKLKHGDQ